MTHAVRLFPGQSFAHFHSTTYLGRRRRFPLLFYCIPIDLHKNAIKMIINNSSSGFRSSPTYMHNGDSPYPRSPLLAYDAIRSSLPTYAYMEGDLPPLPWPLLSAAVHREVLQFLLFFVAHSLASPSSAAAVQRFCAKMRRPIDRSIEALVAILKADDVGTVIIK